MAGAAEHPGSWWTEWAAFLAEHAGDKQKAPARYGNARHKPIEEPRFTRRIGPRAFTHVCSQHAALIDAYATRFAESIPGPVPGSLELVEALDEAGVPLFAITNFGAEFWPAFAPRFPVLECFGDIVISGVEQLAKPDPAIYALAERRFGLPGSAMLFVDDNAHNIAAARASGWHGHHFTNATGLEADLVARGLLG